MDFYHKRIVEGSIDMSHTEDIFSFLHTRRTEIDFLFFLISSFLLRLTHTHTHTYIEKGPIHTHTLLEYPHSLKSEKKKKKGFAITHSERTLPLFSGVSSGVEGMMHKRKLGFGFKFHRGRGSLLFHTPF